jgi:predicted dehydrogenase
MVYNIGIIGCGVIGKRLSYYFDYNPDTTIKMVCDLNKSLADSFARKYLVESTTNYKDLLENDEIDIIYVGVPPGAHFDIIMDSIHAGKHIISEKPLSLNYKMCEDLVEEKNKYPHLLTAVNLPFRFSSEVERLKEEIQSKKLGNLEKIIFTMQYPNWPREWQKVDWLKTRDQGGPLREVGTHFYFLLNELFGKITSVTAQVVFPKNADLCEIEAKGVIKINENIVCEFSLEVGKSQNDINDIVFFGTEGILAFRNWRDLYFTNTQGEELQYVFENIMTLNDMISEFTKVLQWRNKNHFTMENKLVSFEDAAKAQLILDAIYVSKGTEILLYDK